MEKPAENTTYPRPLCRSTRDHFVGGDSEKPRPLCRTNRYIPIDSSGSWPGCAGDKWPALRADIVGFGRALPSRLPTQRVSPCSLRQALPARGPALRATLSAPPAAARGLLSAVRGDLLKVSAPEECRAFPSLQRNPSVPFRMFLECMPQIAQSEARKSARNA